jgi:hypothetical protein
MSEIEESVKFGGVPVYRVALVRESGIGEPHSTPVRKSSEAAKVLRPLFDKLDREHFVVLLMLSTSQSESMSYRSAASPPRSSILEKPSRRPSLRTRQPSSSLTTIRATPLSRVVRMSN